jgi:N-acetylneuraminic acid mutarotase/thiol-disulfide isomerase/thioredoxin
MKRYKKSKFFILFIFLLLLILSYSTKAQGYKAETFLNKKIIDFTFYDLKGNKYTLSSFKGKIVLLNFWATWCGPCRMEVPILEKIYKKYKDRGFEIIAVSLDTNQDNLKSFLKQNQMSFLIVSDREGKLANQYKIEAIPTSFLIDKNLNIIKVYIGIIDEEEIASLLDRLLQKNKPLKTSENGLIWERLPDIPTSRGWAGAVSEGGKIYVIGGCSSQVGQQFRNASNILEVYDPRTNTWRRLSPMSVPRVGPAVASLNGKIYIFGGFNRDTWSANRSVEIYDIAKNNWSLGPPMPTPRSWMRAVVLNNEIYVIGGVGCGYRTDVEIFDPVTNTWETGTPILPRERYLHGAVVCNDKIYVMGGDSWEYGYDEVWDDMQEYNPETDEWVKKNPMPSPASGLSAVAINNKIYVFGGLPKKNIAWIYNVNTDSWSEIPSNNNVPIDGSDAFVYLDGYIYRIGGGGWGPTLSIFERTKISEVEWFFDAIRKYIEGNKTGKLEGFLRENKEHFSKKVWGEIDKELANKYSFACIESSQGSINVKAVEQCKALVNFYVKYVLNKGQYLERDSYVIAKGLKLVNEEEIETIINLERKDYTKEKLINAGVRQGDIFFIYVHPDPDPENRWGHYGIIYDVSGNDIKVLDANRLFDGILRITSIDDLMKSIEDYTKNKDFKWKWIQVVRL